MKSKIKGIVFDMDNTLLRSKIDYGLIKNEIYIFLTRHGILPEHMQLDNHTSSTLIEMALKTTMMSELLINEMWEIAKKHEINGMNGAGLEPGVVDLLEELYGNFHLAIVTNNSCSAAQKALKENNIIHYFEHVVGREMVTYLKPSPDAFLYILNCYMNTASKEWISVGDAWIDGKASQIAGIKFIAYQGNLEKMNKAGVYPDGTIKHISEILNYI